MFRPIALFIGLRYTRAKRRNHFISFISLTSMIGIALGVAVLITVLSVMNGFDDVIRNRIMKMARQVTISTYSGHMADWQKMSNRMQHYPGVVATAPYVDGQAMLMNEGQVHPAMVIGVSTQEEKKVSQIGESIIQGSMDDLKPNSFGVLIGQQLADSLGLGIGDKVISVIPQATLTPAGLIPRFKRLTVVGIFKIGSGFEYDNSVAFVELNDAQKLFALGSDVTGIRLKLKDLYAAPKVANNLNRELPSPYSSSDWTQVYGSLFEAIKLEKSMISLLLTLIVAVAAFNLVSTLVMVVTDKKSDIAILRTLGATPRTILATFMVQGSVIGIVGTFIGVLSGIILALNVTNLVSFIETHFHIQLLARDVYYVNYLPSKLVFSDVVIICITSLLLSLLATLYPAWQASRIQPAEALRYE